MAMSTSKMQRQSNNSTNWIQGNGPNVPSTRSSTDSNRIALPGVDWSKVLQSHIFNAQSIKDWKIAQLLLITICYLIEASYRIYALSNLKTNKPAIKSMLKSVSTHFQTSIKFTLNIVILTVFSVFFCFSKRFWRWGNICYE